MVKYLTKFGANLNIRAEDGMNAIHVACQNGSLEMVQILVNFLSEYF
jgi:ankyrin repeat protein